ncbi:hypothetical protein [Streptococcus sp. LYSM12]|uniref:hypothetical protein n=1 Tax=unclassified Streptococcus TaxID=2608887 RepID=UPI00142FA1A5|nr:hypothetical protein [Streptococcus sp. LYSM12]MCQ9213561.1 hypothetical protein [Streptococcus sp. O1]
MTILKKELDYQQKGGVLLHQLYNMLGDNKKGVGKELKPHKKAFGFYLISCMLGSG